MTVIQKSMIDTIDIDIGYGGLQKVMTCRLQKVITVYCRLQQVTEDYSRLQH